MRRFLLAVLCLLWMFESAQATVCARMDDAAALISEDGTEIVAPGVYEDIVHLDGDLFAALGEGGYALMNAQGELLSAAVYAELRPAEGALIAKRDGAWGLLGPDGIELSAFVYEQIVPTGEGGYWATRESGDGLEISSLCLLDAVGAETVADLSVRQMADTASEGLISVLLPGSGLWGYCDAQGRTAIDARFSYAGEFSGGCAAVVENGRYGAIDASGGWIAEPDYDYLEVSPAGFILAARAREGAWVLNASGQEIASYAGEDLSVGLVGSGYAVSDAESLRLYDADGTLIAQADSAASVVEGVNGQYILSDGMWGEACVGIVGTEARYQNLYPLGVAGETGVYACMQANAARYVNDLLGEIQISVDMDTARYGLVNDAGEQILSCAYESISALADDRFLVYGDGAWQMIDAQGVVYWALGATKTEEPNS